MKPCSVYGASQSAFRSGRDTTRAGRLYSDGILKSFANYVTRIDVRGRKGATTTHRTPDFTSESRRFSGRRPLSLSSPSRSPSLSLPLLSARISQPLCRFEHVSGEIALPGYSLMSIVDRRAVERSRILPGIRSSARSFSTRERRKSRGPSTTVCLKHGVVSPRGTFAGILNIPV